MPTLLSTTITHKDQTLEIFVKYNADDNTVEEIKSVFLNSHGMKIPVGDLFINTPELDVAINKIIDRIDWREINQKNKDWWYNLSH